MPFSRLWLPNEVLSLIGERINDHSDRYELPLVSHQFYQAFSPLLYQDVRLRNWRQALSFFQAIIQRPFLASTVRELDASGWQGSPVPQSDWPSLHECPALTRHIHGMTHSFEELVSWTDHLLQGRSDVWVALVLPLLSHLEKLSLVCSASPRHLTRVLQRGNPVDKSTASQAILCRLRAVSVFHQNNSASQIFEEQSDHNQPEVLSSFMQLPSMRAVVADSVVESQVSGEEITSPATNSLHQKMLSTPSITEIDLRNSCGNEGMKSLLFGCTNLKSFKYQHSDQHLASHGFQPARLRRWLSPSKESLETLWLDQYGDHYAFTVAGLNQTQDEWFGSLAEFSALKDVRIRLPNLLDIQYQNPPSHSLVSCLPPTLEIILIEGCAERHVSMLVSELQSVIKIRHTHFPRIQLLGLEGPFQALSTDEEQDAVQLPGQSRALCYSIKPKVLQAVEPLHEDCVSASIAFHLHDRKLVSKADDGWTPWAGVFPPP
ncbi:hypothetical protein N7539_004698 [Penicillium diatomitis]|uniref:Leucine-rich repeat domain-containing protein n=1 Tax=Penicillium diatomitis TaxID=2819901 RepID=A0A9X0BUJ0_9EURO|nr:uncharacterized protein N7539_004698 [Penicillium diatomitis]KAJ5484710.1 hypothetical protein N7539_004698 [Penicillium diatomitis]